MNLACRVLCPALLLLIAVACGDEAPPRQDGAAQQCDPYTCSGCCLNGVCMNGTTPDGCGTGGYGCNVCKATEQCKLGLCQLKSQTCGASSCATGCCLGTTCMGGISLSSCGTGGGACKMCNNTEKCISGSCVPTSGSCGTSNCTGCCQNKQCKSGTSANACGSGGETCKACKSNEKCQAGVCVPSSGSCGPSTCASGCCENNSCKLGTSLSACGTGGASCQACKSNEKCTSQVCTGSGPTMYKVYLKSATVDSPWLACAESNCDLYVKLQVGSTTATSTIKADNNNPIWNEMLMIISDTKLKTSFKATVYDDDYGPDPTVGGCTATITPSVLLAGKVETQCTYLTIKVCKVTFTFVKN